MLCGLLRASVIIGAMAFVAPRVDSAAVACFFAVFQPLHFAWKAAYYVRHKWHPFFLDFCYTINAMTWACCVMVVADSEWGAANGAAALAQPVASLIRRALGEWLVGRPYALTLLQGAGPVALATFIWGCQIFFNPRSRADVDALSSTFFHLGPALVVLHLKPVSQKP